jgi:dUTP pyrophosphatase
MSNENFIIKNGERICQMVIKRYEKVSLIEVDNLNDTERGVGGFGHTGIK